MAKSLEDILNGMDPERRRLIELRKEEIHRDYLRARRRRIITQTLLLVTFGILLGNLATRFIMWATQ